MIYSKLESKTIIIIAHRLSTIINCDKIFVFNKGCLVEQGKHKELLTLNGEYKKLWDLQQGITIRKKKEVKETTIDKDVVEY